VAVSDELAKLDPNGVDEGGWRRDRRVDLELQN
jgi:hypothetical protein